MKREVFADSEVERIVNSQLTSVQIDIDEPSTKELVKHFNIGATPTTLLVDAQGKVVNYAVGNIDKDQFLEMLSHVGI